MGGGGDEKSGKKYQFLKNFFGGCELARGLGFSFGFSIKESIGTGVFHFLRTGGFENVLGDAKVKFYPPRRWCFPVLRSQ